MKMFLALAICLAVGQAEVAFSKESVPQRRLNLDDEMPIRDMFYVLETNFFSTTMSCPEIEEAFREMVMVDSTKYPNLTNHYQFKCTTHEDGRTDLWVHLNLDAWGNDAIPEFKDYFAKHQGMTFSGKRVHFKKVVAFAFAEIVELQKNGRTIHSSPPNWHQTQYEDQIRPNIESLQELINFQSSQQFLNFIEQKYGTAERTAFSQALPQTTTLSYTVWVSLLLEDGKALFSNEGYGDERDCSSSGCFNSL
jgi:hypothetical protein